MDRLIYWAFADELEKRAAILQTARSWLGAPGRVLGGTLRDVQHLVSNPASALREGWAHMSPVERAAKTLKGQGELVAKMDKTRSGGALRRTFGAGTHLGTPSQTLGDAWRTGRGRGVAEELSRRGWTGESRATKYLPLGQKGMAASIAASEIPGVANAEPATPTGEGGRLERGLGSLASNAAWVATAPMGLPAMLIGSEGARAGAGRLGRVLDRLRAGADVGTAAMAPSPAEATEQLRRIDQYYGQGS